MLFPSPTTNYFPQYNAIESVPDKHRENVQNLLNRLEGSQIRHSYPLIMKKFTIFFVTMNPRIDVNKWNEDIKKMTKKWKKVAFATTLFNFEFATPNGYKLHSHGLVFLLKKGNEIGPKWFLKKDGFMMKILGDKQKIDVKRVATQDSLIRYIKYIFGDKKNEKVGFVDDDRRIRLNHFNPRLPNYTLHQNSPERFWRLKATLDARLVEAHSGSTLTFN